MTTFVPSCPRDTSTRFREPVHQHEPSAAVDLEPRSRAPRLGPRAEVAHGDGYLVALQRSLDVDRARLVHAICMFHGVRASLVARGHDRMCLLAVDAQRIEPERELTSNSPKVLGLGGQFEAKAIAGGIFHSEYQEGGVVACLVVHFHRPEQEVAAVVEIRRRVAKRHLQSVELRSDRLVPALDQAVRVEEHDRSLGKRVTARPVRRRCEIHPAAASRPPRADAPCRPGCARARAGGRHGRNRAARRPG